MRRSFDIGDRIGPYEVRAFLGAGGMGDVYIAADTRLQREVALKALPASSAADPAWVARFDREARALARVNHPSIVTIHDFGTQSGVPYLVTELLSGQTVRERLRAGPVPLEIGVEWARQIADGLVAAHAAGIIHRDLKPENLFITAAGPVKILDFGIATLGGADLANASTLASADTQAERLTATGEVIGTVGYMAPEQVRGGPADERSDIFSFGAVLYEIATGHKAFEGESRPEIAVAIIQDEPAAMGRSDAQIPPVLEEITRRCLAKKPGDRFQTVADVRTALDRLQLGSTPVSRPLWTPGRAMLALFGAVAIGAAAVAGLWMTRRAERGTAPLAAAVDVPRRGDSVAHLTRLTYSRDVFDGKLMPGAESLLLTRHNPAFQVSLGSVQGGERPLPALSNHVIHSVSSSTGAFLVTEPATWTGGVLSIGSVEREELEQIATDVTSAAWGPDGSSIVATTLIGGEYRLEFPMGTILLRSPIPLVRALVSPGRDRIAFIECAKAYDDRCRIAIVDLGGNSAVRTPYFVHVGLELAWAPAGSTVYFTALEEGEGGYRMKLWAWRPPAAPEVLLKTPDALGIADVRPDGRLLVRRTATTNFVHVHRGQGRTDVELPAYEAPGLVGIDGNGDFVLVVDEGGPLAPPSVDALYARRTDGSTPVFLGPASWAALSPDGKRIVVQRSGASPDLRIIAAPGAPELDVELPAHGVTERQWPAWSHDGESILFVGKNERGEQRLYLQKVTGEPPVSFGPIGVNIDFESSPVSPDGRWMFARDRDQVWVLLSMDGTRTRRLPQLDKASFLKGWTADGRSLLLLPGSAPTRIERLDPQTGGRKELVALDRARDLQDAWNVVFSSNGLAWAHQRSEVTSDLYLVELPGEK